MGRMPGKPAKRLHVSSLKAEREKLKVEALQLKITKMQEDIKDSRLRRALRYLGIGLAGLAAVTGATVGSPAPSSPPEPQPVTSDETIARIVAELKSALAAGKKPPDTAAVAEALARLRNQRKQETPAATKWIKEIDNLMQLLSQQER